MKKYSQRIKFLKQSVFSIADGPVNVDSEDYLINVVSMYKRRSPSGVHDLAAQPG
jgi:hypothetical protein